MTWKELVVIFIVLIVLGIAGLYFGGNAVKSTGGDIVNATNGSVLLGWAGVPIGSFLMDTGNAWVKTAVSMTEMIMLIMCVFGAILYLANQKP
jgi:hypothetical protein